VLNFSTFFHKIFDLRNSQARHGTSKLKLPCTHAH
jgi:hypothetical protein